MNRLLVLLISFIFIGLDLFGQDATPLFEAGSKAYRVGNYGEAVAQYESILKMGLQSLEVYYNLGNSYYQLGQNGKAILNYERAAILAPRDEDVLFNLQLARQKLTDELERVDDFFLSRWIRWVRGCFSTKTWSFIALMFLWLSAAGWVVWLVGSERTLKKRGFIGGVVCLILSILPFALASGSAGLEKDSHAAIVVVPETAIKNAPDDAGKTENTLHEGFKVELMDKIGNWYKVKLPNGEQGWANVSALEKI